MCGSGKRLIPIAAVVLAATAALLGPVPEAVDASFGRGTTEHKVIARDDKIFGLWAVGDTVLYGRSAKRRRWMRVVDGRRLTAHLPAGAFVTSVGRDPAGRVVAVVGTSARSSIYDVASDVRRPVPVSDRPGCVVTSVSVWRTRLVYYNVCRGVILRDGTRETSVGALSYDNEPPQLFLRGRSLAADGIARDESHRVWRILDHGRRCRAVVDSIDPVDDWSRRAVTISRNELRWALAVDTALPGDGGNEIHKTDLTVMSVALSGGCDAPPTQRLVALDVTRKPIRAYALDGAFLLYATDSAIRRVRLPRRGSTPRPPNDDFDRATAIELDRSIVGRVGHASLQAGEPEVQGARRTVWLRFKASRTEQLHLVARGFRFSVFTGADLPSLTAIGSSVDNLPFQDDVSISVVAGQTYSIQVASVGPYPTYKPFRIRTLDT